MDCFRTNKTVFVASHLIVLSIFFLLTLLFYAPPQSGHDFVYFGYGYDPLIYIWFLNWWPFAISHHIPLFFTHFVDAPVGTNLAWKTGMPALSLIASPFTIKFGALKVYNVLCLMAPSLTGWGVYLAAFELTADLCAAIAGGVLFCLSSYMISQMQGHLNLAFIVAIPLCLWACIAAAKHNWGKWRLGSVLGILLAFQLGVSQEVYATFCLFAVIAVVALFILDRRQHPALVAISRGMALGFILSLIICAPIIGEMLHWYGNDTSGILPPEYMTSDLLGLIVPTRIAWIGGQFFSPISAKFSGNISEQSAYLGLPLLGLLGFIFNRHKNDAGVRYLSFIALVSGVLSLGPYVRFDGTPVSTAPWILAVNLPILHNMYPDRFMMYAQLAIAMLCSLWLSKKGHKPFRYFLLAVCLIFLLPDKAVDRNWTALHIPTIFTDNTIPSKSQILVLPDYGDEMAFQYASGMRFSLVGQGYLITGDPEPFARWPIFNSLRNSSFTNIDPRIFADYLAYYGVQEVIVTRSNYFDYWHDKPLDNTAAAIAATRLLVAAGWHVIGVNDDTTWLRPRVTRSKPTPSQVAALMNMPSVESQIIHREKSIHMERRWVCDLRTIARFAGVPSGRLLAVYSNHAHPPLAVNLIDCGDQ